MLALFKPSVWLAGLWLTVASLHLILESRFDTDGFVTLSLLFWMSAAYLLWDKRPLLNFQTDRFSVFWGCCILSLGVVGALTVFRQPSYLVPLKFFPVLGSLGCALLASGSSGLIQYRRELLLLFFLSFPAVILRVIPLNMTVWSAKLATFFLWYVGFDVTRTHDVIRFPNRSIFVFPDCSGIEGMAYLWSLSFLISTFLGLPTRFRVVLGGSAILLGFVLNSFRVVILALLARGYYHEQFNFWHDGTGSWVFSAIGAIALMGISYWLSQLTSSQSSISDLQAR